MVSSLAGEALAQGRHRAKPGSKGVKRDRVCEEMLEGCMDRMGSSPGSFWVSSLGCRSRCTHVDVFAGVIVVEQWLPQRHNTSLLTAAVLCQHPTQQREKHLNNSAGTFYIMRNIISWQGSALNTQRKICLLQILPEDLESSFLETEE
ncbi:hypothetical protein AV530_019547 [Patagioenas fasciata monilis]|uniref:Uncharacterized protein n=1 Tax=Patagioenas fasciata monilis TaxID=372326 RepID=A0A1V4JE03_PATFA|nr:hypothetical protein AV530_019547 [Patagioenas fasciata monilis]